MKKNVFLVLIFLCVQFCNAQWVVQTTPPTNASYWDGEFLNSNTGYFCSGTPGSIIKTTNGGINWNVMWISDTNNAVYFNGIEVVNENLIYAVEKRSVLKTTNGGVSWTQYFFPTGFNFFCYDVSFASPNTGYAVGGANPSGGICKTTNGGINWFRLNSPNSSYDFWEILMLDDDTGFVIGGHDDLNFANLLKTTNGGLNWINVNTTYSGSFSDINFLNSDTGYVVGGKILRTTDKGVTWNLLNNTNLSGANSICFPSVKTGYAGVTWETGFPVTHHTKTIKSTDYGVTWFDMNGAEEFGYSKVIKFVNDFTGWYSSGGVIKKTSNGGSTFINNNSNQIPANFSLQQNYPNPFNPNTVISYKLSVAGDISLNVYDANGRLIKILESGYKPAGEYSTNFSAEGLSSGVYYYSLYADGVLIDTKKSILLK